MFCAFTFDRGLRFWSGLLVFQVHRGCWGFHTGLIFEVFLSTGHMTKAGPQSNIVPKFSLGSPRPRFSLGIP